MNTSVGWVYKRANKVGSILQICNLVVIIEGVWLCVQVIVCNYPLKMYMFVLCVDVCVQYHGRTAEHLMAKSK